MPYLVAAVVFVGALCAVDLLLTVAVIRRLREYSQRLTELTGAPAAAIEPTVDRVPAFTATTVDGRALVGPDLGRSVIAFFATDCPACNTEVPRFVQHVVYEGYERDSVLTVVAGVDTTKGVRMVEGLRRVAAVVREPLDGVVCGAFEVTRFPTFVLVDGDGKVRAAAPTVAGLPSRVPT